MLEFRWFFVFKMKSYPSILVVDDDQDLVNMLERFLKEEGYQVTKAYDGNSAIDLLETQYRPGLIFLDINMPGVDGFEVLDFVRRRYNIPVIILTEKRDITTQSDAFARGADDYITKPFSQRVLLARMKAKLRRTGPIDT
ncbi:response regulator transcription factor [Chloroflexota bacterium]